MPEETSGEVLRTRFLPDPDSESLKEPESDSLDLGLEHERNVYRPMLICIPKDVCRGCLCLLFLVIRVDFVYFLHF